MPPAARHRFKAVLIFCLSLLPLVALIPVSGLLNATYHAASAAVGQSIVGRGVVSLGYLLAWAYSIYGFYSSVGTTRAKITRLIDGDHPTA